MKILKKVLLGGLVLFALLIGAGYVVFFSPLNQPPEIGRDLPDNFADADIEFKRRVKAEFKLPMPEHELTAWLEAQGFKVDSNNRFAIYEKPDLVCTLVWFFSWETFDKLVTDINPVYGGRCL